MAKCAYCKKEAIDRNSKGKLVCSEHFLDDISFGRVTRCAYCENPSVGDDMLGIPSCQEHMHYADIEYERRTGKNPNEDSFEFCPEHGDFWLAGCERCETCSQHHYGMSIAEANQAGVFDIQVLSFGPEDADEKPQSFHFSHGEDE